MTSLPLLYLCMSPENGDAHWRVIRPAVRLKEAGADARICWLGADQMPTESVAGRVVILQQMTVDGEEGAAQAWVDRLKAAGAVAVVYDTDDDEWTGSHIDHQAAATPISTAGHAALERSRLARIATLRACDGVTVSTEPLAAVVRRYTDRPVVVVPNAIDVEWFRARLAPRAPWADVLTIGWAGWWRPEADLAPMAAAWARIAARYPDVRFVVGGHQSDVIYRQDIDLDRIIRLPVVPTERYPTLYQVDIGCCAVADSPFSWCKSVIKAYEYALAGAAVVATPALYGDVISDGTTGLLAETADEWESALAALIERPEARNACAQQFSRQVERWHSLVSNIGTWTRAYQQIVASVRVPA